MKKLITLALCLAALATAPGFAQVPLLPVQAQVPAPPLVQFDLDFPGGTPKQLVTAIQTAMRRPVNVIIPLEYAEWKLPPLKMNNVTVPRLFRTLELAGRVVSINDTGNGNYQQSETTYGFRTNAPANIDSDESVWYFFVQGPATMPNISRFYYLGPYLDAGLSVDDITTAIQTGWRMRGDANPPKLSFHKETKLLIAVGSNVGLNVAESVLRALDAVKGRPPAEKPADAAKAK